MSDVPLSDYFVWRACGLSLCCFHYEYISFVTRLSRLTDSDMSRIANAEFNRRDVVSSHTLTQLQSAVTRKIQITKVSHVDKNS